MVQDNVTYGVVTAVAADGLTGWTTHLPDPTLQNFMYIATIGWILFQVYCKLRGK